MIYMIWFLIILLVGICIASFFDKSEKSKELERINTECLFSSKLDKLLKNLTQDEQILYRKMFDTINYVDPSHYIISKTNDNLSVDGIVSVQIKNMIIGIVKTEKVSGFTTDGKPYGRGIAKYMCSEATVINPKTKERIELSPPKEQLPIYDLIVNYIIFKLEIYYEKQIRDEEKKISEEHQATIKSALKTFKGV